MRFGLLVLTTMCMVGCGGSGIEEMKVAYVSGKVTMNGEPVTSGRIMFYPTVEEGSKSGKAGKPAQGTVSSDGSFELSTYGSNDGAVVGTHQVTVMEEATPDPESSRKQVGFLDGTVTVVADKSNKINIELKPPRKPQERIEENEDD